MAAKRNGHGGKRAGAGRKRDPRRVQAYAEIGPPPADPLEGSKWFGRLLFVAAHHVVTDERLTEKERRLELRQLAKAASAMVPHERLLEAERIVRDDVERMERIETGTKLVDATTEAGSPLRFDS